MRQVRIETLMKETNMNESELALYVGVSVALISKLKNNNVILSKNTLLKFQDKFGDIELLNGMPKYKELYLKERSKSQELQHQIEDLIVAYNQLKEEFEQIRNICEKVVYLYE